MALFESGIPITYPACLVRIASGLEAWAFWIAPANFGNIPDQVSPGPGAGIGFYTPNAALGIIGSEAWGAGQASEYAAAQSSLLSAIQSWAEEYDWGVSPAPTVTFTQVGPEQLQTITPS